MIQKLGEKFKALKERKKLIMIYAAGVIGAVSMVWGAYFMGLRSSASSSAGHASHSGKDQAAKTSSQAPEQEAEIATEVRHAPGSLAALLGRYAKAIRSVQEKAEILRQADEENERLRLENSNLRLRLESLQFDCSSKSASSQTHEMQLRLSGETGAKVGRTLASIQYRPPTHLLPPQLFTLGVSYFKAGEDEKAAVIFTFLTNLDENEAYKTAKNLVMTGVAWYRLDHYELADHFFERALKTEGDPESLPYHAQARLWKALTAERTNKRLKAQYWLRELIDHHPQSAEATWVNSREVLRAPSSEARDSAHEE